MCLPREILPGRTYLITRRCTQRQFLLRPDDQTNGIFAYCLAEAAQRHSIDLVAWVAMSNHYHAVVTDPEGRLPAFLEHLHKMLAKALNVRWSRWENLWSSEQTSVVYLPTADDIFDKVVYVLANPVAAHLVDRLVDWPGCSSLRHMTTARVVHRRPLSFFRATGGTMPDRAELRAVLPSSIAQRESLAAWSARVHAAVEERERASREERLRDGQRVVGRKAVLRTSAFHAPSTPEAKRELRPALACKDRERRIVELAKLLQFRKAHASARRLFAGGDHRIEFPPGTYRMRAWGARCAPFPVAA